MYTFLYFVRKSSNIDQWSNNLGYYLVETTPFSSKMEYSDKSNISENSFIFTIKWYLS